MTAAKRKVPKLDLVYPAAAANLHTDLEQIEMLSAAVDFWVHADPRANTPRVVPSWVVSAISRVYDTAVGAVAGFEILDREVISPDDGSRESAKAAE